jgi:hypothetical protein
VAHAEGRVRLKSAQQIGAIVIYEDSGGPIPGVAGVRETAATHYAVYVHEVASKQWRRIGRVADNANLVNVFECPLADVDEIRYFWAGRNDVDKTDGLVRMAELEAYSADDLSGILDATGGPDDSLNRAP